MSDQQTATDVKLDLIHSDVKEIKGCLFGNGGKDGMRIDVDRLKQSRTTHTAIFWIIFTAAIGAIIASTFNN